MSNRNTPYILHRPKYGVHAVSARETGAHVGTVECLQRARYQATRPDGESRWFTTRRDACWHLLSWHTERENERIAQEGRDQELVAQMAAAHNAGRAWAETLKVGDFFQGSFAAAEAQGFGEPRLRSVFTQAALDILQHKRVITDMAGILVEYRDQRPTDQGDRVQLGGPRKPTALVSRPGCPDEVV